MKDIRKVIQQVHENTLPKTQPEPVDLVKEYLEGYFGDSLTEGSVNEEDIHNAFSTLFDTARSLYSYVYEDEVSEETYTVVGDYFTNYFNGYDLDSLSEENMNAAIQHAFDTADAVYEEINEGRMPFEIARSVDEAVRPGTPTHDAKVQDRIRARDNARASLAGKPHRRYGERPPEDRGHVTKYKKPSARQVAANKKHRAQAAAGWRDIADPHSDRYNTEQRRREFDSVDEHMPADVLGRRGPAHKAQARIKLRDRLRAQIAARPNRLTSSPPADRGHVTKYKKPSARHVAAVKKHRAAAAAHHAAASADAADRHAGRRVE